MSREKREPWKQFGLKESTYYYQLRKGALSGNYKVPKSHKGRYSGLTYENPKERLLEIRERYKNGIPEGTIEAMLGIESGG